MPEKFWWNQNTVDVNPITVILRQNKSFSALYKFYIYYAMFKDLLLCHLRVMQKGSDISNWSKSLGEYKKYDFVQISQLW